MAKAKILGCVFALIYSGLLFGQDLDDHGDHNGFMRGDMFVSGVVGYNSEKNANGSKEWAFKASPRYGYFINDFMAVGGRLGYSIHNLKDKEGQKIGHDNTFTVDVFGRYYLLPGSKFSVFGEIDLGFGFMQNVNHDWTNGVNVGLNPGISYFLGQHFALEATFGVLSYNTVSTHHEGSKTHSFEVGLDAEDINFGIIYKF